MDGEFVERKIGALKLAYEKNKELAVVHGGPAVMEVFGEVPFEPQIKSEALTLDTKQQKLSVKYSNDAGKHVNEYIKGEERSFTIIAYPILRLARILRKYSRVLLRLIPLIITNIKLSSRRLLMYLIQHSMLRLRGLTETAQI